MYRVEKLLWETRFDTKKCSLENSDNSTVVQWGVNKTLDQYDGSEVPKRGLFKSVCEEELIGDELDSHYREVKKRDG